jgi:hypothetical protein
MSIGADIEDVLEELGMTVSVIRPNVTTVQEKIEISTPYRVSQPFIREFLSEGSLRYNTAIQPGDILTGVKTGLSYLVMSINPEGFEDEVIEYVAFLYKCNRKGIILQQVDADDWDQQYRSTMRWEHVYTEVIPFLLYDKQAFDRAITLQYTWEQFASTSAELYFSGWYDVPTLSRLRIFQQDLGTWQFWNELTSYAIGETVLIPDTYQMFISLTNYNTDNNPIEADEYDPVLHWREIPYIDLKLERVDFNRFENVNIFSAAADVR